MYFRDMKKNGAKIRWQALLEHQSKKVGKPVLMAHVEADTGIPRQSLIYYRQGRQPTLRIARKLARYFGVTIEEMFDWGDEAPANR